MHISMDILAQILCLRYKNTDVYDFLQQRNFIWTGSKFFPYSVEPLSEEDKQLEQLSPLKVYRFPLKGKSTLTKVVSEIKCIPKHLPQ